MGNRLSIHIYIYACTQTYTKTYIRKPTTIVYTYKNNYMYMNYTYIHNYILYKKGIHIHKYTHTQEHTQKECGRRREKTREREREREGNLHRPHTRRQDFCRHTSHCVSCGVWYLACIKNWRKQNRNAAYWASNGLGTRACMNTSSNTIYLRKCPSHHCACILDAFAGQKSRICWDRVVCTCSDTRAAW